MMTDKQKESIMKWRKSHPRKVYELTSKYNKAYREKNRDKEIERLRQYRLQKSEFKKFLNILIDF